jgi:uncharacterized delta-60 repeat protein
MNYIRKLFLVTAIFAIQNIYAQPGANDLSFNTFDDCTYGNGSGPAGEIYTSTVQPDGKILIGGATFNGISGLPLGRSIVRINTDGSPDLTYNSGAVHIAPTSGNGIKTISVQSDGKIIVGGGFNSLTANASNFLRLNPDGSFDNTFNIGSGFSSYVNSTAIQPDGKILVTGGFSSYNGSPVPSIARLNPDGSLDSTFNAGTGANNNIFKILLQPDGKIIVVGFFTTFDGAPRGRIARLEADGSLDVNFIPTGTGFNNTVNHAALQSDGKIVVGGVFTSFNGISRNRVAMINSDGTLDTSFNPGTGPDNNVYTVSLQQDGKIIIGGFFSNFVGVSRKGIVRLNTNGSLDTSFNPGSGFSFPLIYTTSIQSNGKIIVGGRIEIFNGTRRINIARLNIDGSLDTSFKQGTGFDNDVMSINLQANGKIIVGGDFISYNDTTRNKIARLNANGTLDTSFDPGIGFDFIVNTTSVQSDGKIIAGGLFTTFSGTATNRIARLNTNGTLDATLVTGSGFSNAINNAKVYTTAIQIDGKIIVGGDYTTYNGTTRNRISRINTNGSNDASFNIGSGFNGDVLITKIQTDGKIIVGGAFGSFNGNTRVRIVRLNTDGTLDATFNIGTGFNGNVYSIYIQTDGKIIVGGAFSSYNGVSRNKIARLNTDGTLDLTFNPGTGFDNTVNSITVQQDGKVIVGGIFGSYNGSVKNKIARLNTDGTLDMYFNQGTGPTNYGSSLFGVISSIDIQPDGKIIVGGDFDKYDSNCRTRITRLNTQCTNSTSTDVISSCDSYIWIDGLTYNTSNNSAVFTLTNSTGCDSIITLNLTINNSPTAISSSSGATFYGATDGTVDLTISGGVPPYRFFWSNGAITEDLNSVAAGIYTVTVVDANDCTTTATATVNQPPLSVVQNDLKIDVNVIPNPFNNTAQLILEGLENSENLELEIYNLNGQRIQFLNDTQNGQFQLSRGEMSQGIYFFSVQQNGKVVARGKMVVE